MGRDLELELKPEPNKSAINEIIKPLGFFGALFAPRVKRASVVPYIDTGRVTRKIKSIIIHCTATPEGRAYSVKDIDSWHRQRGYDCIGYHFVILLDGTIAKGRSIEIIGAHTYGHNTGSIGIAYVGGMNKNNTKAKDTRTKVQIASGIALINSLVKRFPGTEEVHGHNEFANRACPSFIVANDVWGRLI
jgi:N-acetylmuramoyl-L-alanine amidase